MNGALWLAQIVLAILFVLAGYLKATQPMAELARLLPWTAEVPEALVRFIGVAELAGAVGLVLPALTRVKPELTAWAATGLATIMALAAAFHLSRGETEMLPVNLILGGIAAFVAWGRFRKVPLLPRA